jgi:hypothetical protein
MILFSFFFFLLPFVPLSFVLFCFFNFVNIIVQQALFRQGDHANNVHLELLTPAKVLLGVLYPFSSASFLLPQHGCLSLMVEDLPSRSLQQ